MDKFRHVGGGGGRFCRRARAFSARRVGANSARRTRFDSAATATPEPFLLPRPKHILSPQLRIVYHRARAQSAAAPESKRKPVPTNKGGGGGAAVAAFSVALLCLCSRKGASACSLIWPFIFIKSIVPLGSTMAENFQTLYKNYDFYQNHIPCSGPDLQDLQDRRRIKDEKKQFLQSCAK